MKLKGLPVAPSMKPTLDSVRLPKQSTSFGYRVVKISVISIFLGIAAGLTAQILTHLIGLITNISFYGKISTDFVSPAYNKLGLWVIIVPVVGAIIVGLIARYGSKGIRGHGIPEAMEQVLLNESKIPPRLTFLKPLSAAVSIGTGGPFGAEGPIIATGGALGSFIGQIIKTSASERKTLLAAGAAAGMAATFGSPVSAILLSVELLLFEFRPQSIIPVTLASATATAVRIFFVGTEPIFQLPNLQQPGNLALVSYLITGALIGVASVFVTKAVYKVEDTFEKIPIHWMWWPAIGAIAVGVIGYFFPKTMGVGYDNIENIISGNILGGSLILLFVFKFLSWSISLGSGTSGGTLAPLFTIGGGLGALLGAIGVYFFPDIGIDPRIAALVGMAALFAGSARALLTAIIFAFETTMQPIGLLPLLAGCSASYVVSSLMMRYTIMTEKIARRGIRIPTEYAADFLDQVLIKDCATYKVVTLKADETIQKIRTWFAEGTSSSIYHGFPVLNENDDLVGVVTRRELLAPDLSLEKTVGEIISHPLAVAYEDNTVREAADLMAEFKVTRLPVVDKKNHKKIIAIISRQDVLDARKRNLEGETKFQKSIKVPTVKVRRK